jgi:hypothetical protein
MTTPSPQHDALHCQACGYNLFGIESPNCPECGLIIDRTRLGESKIPWTHRKHIGIFRAFRRTGSLAIFHPQKLAEEINHPVSYADAQSFRMICISVGTLSLTIPAILFAFFHNNSAITVIDRIAGCALIIPSTFLFFLAATGLPALFFRPASLPILRQNRAVALSYYSAAPLTFLFVPVLIDIIIMLLLHFLPNLDRSMALLATIGMIAFYMPPLLVFYLVFIAAILFKRTTHSSRLKFWAILGALFIGEALLLAAIQIGIPVAGFFVAVVFSSLK